MVRGTDLAPLRRVLVTGASGQLGREVVALLRGKEVEVTALDLVSQDDLEADRLVVGSASDVAAVRQAVEGIDAVVHLAAIRAPGLGTAEEVFCGNSTATFTVLEQAAQAGVRRAVIASSYSITGLPFAPHRRHPAYLPIDEQLPLQVEDPYALSKQVDEATAKMMWWRHGLSVVAIRFPYLGSLADTLPKRAARIAEDPSFASTEMWSYLETRDGALASVLALEKAPPGYHVVGLAAPNTLAAEDTNTLLDRFHPDVPRRRQFCGREVPIDVSAAQQLLGWSAQHVFSPSLEPGAA
ncbi:MAG: NAD-dependent epimerase/dehydratase [Acidimicrobiaceae bacterium]|nr:NAD-dependent epimerase/dehydratase [Acidimicrobiaceae bacterium]